MTPYKGRMYWLAARTTREGIIYNHGSRFLWDYVNPYGVLGPSSRFLLVNASIAHDRLLNFVVKRLIVLQIPRN